MSKDFQNPESYFQKIRRYGAQVVKSVFTAIIFVLILKGTVVEATQIYGASMTPTLLEGDYIFVNKFKYGLHFPLMDKMTLLWSEPERGDVITFLPPEGSLKREKKIFIKRIVAVAGDRVEIIRSKLYINGAPVESGPVKGGGFVYRETMDGKEYRVVKKNPVSYFKPLIVPEGHVFAIGDNRDNSYDSRNWGPLPIENIKGKAAIIYFTKTISGSLKNFARIGGFL